MHIFHGESNPDLYLPRCSSEASSTSASWTPSPLATLTTARLVSEVVFFGQNLLDNGKIFSKGTWPCFLFWYLVKTCCSGDQPSVRQWALDDHQAGQGWQCRWEYFGQDLFLHEMLAFDWFDAGEVDLELFNAVIEDLEENALKNKQRRRREVRAGVWECGERSLLVSIKIDENFWVCAGCAWTRSYSFDFSVSSWQAFCAEDFYIHMCVFL